MRFGRLCCIKQQYSQQPCTQCTGYYKYINYGYNYLQFPGLTVIKLKGFSSWLQLLTRFADFYTLALT